MAPAHPLCQQKGHCQLLKVKPEDITEIRRWALVIQVVGKGFSRFVSYADLPPIAGVALPCQLDFNYWRKRWKNKQSHPTFGPNSTPNTSRTLTGWMNWTCGPQ